MIQIIKKIKDYRITEVVQIYKITFWLTILCAVIVIGIIALGK